LLTEMDGIAPLRNVVVIGATNRPDILDPALLRPGRFDRLIYVPPPDTRARLVGKDVDLDKIVALTEGYSGADIAALCREAALVALREAGRPTKVTMKHFEEALKVVKPSLDPEEVKKYEKIAETFRKMLS